MLIAVDHLWQDGRLLADQVIELAGGQIVAIRPSSDDAPIGMRCHVLMPACTDLQVNGGGGVMLNDAPTAQTMRRMAAAHRALGTGAIMPTVITDAPEVMEAAASAAIETRGEPGLLGLHIEGPHIAPAKRGTHDARFIRPLDDRTIQALRALRRAQVPVILTLAPETVTAEQIRDLAAIGVVVSAGHSMATAAQARAGFDAGVSMVTHLFNAMPPLLHRDPGLAGAAILSQAFCGIIADGIHVSWEALRIAIAARPRSDRMFLVSDAMATVGGPDHFTLYGQTIRVQDGALVNAEGNLAGAHTDMLRSLAGLVRHAGVPLAQAIAMATDIPRAAIGLPPEAGVLPGAGLDGLVALDHQLALMTLDQG